MLESLAAKPGATPAATAAATAPATATAPAPRTTAVITGLGAAIPETVVGNAAIAELIGVDAAWIERRTGIRARRRVTSAHELVPLAADAGRAALAQAGLEAADVELLILATVSQEQPLPTLAAQVAAALGADAAGAFDLGAACTGFIAAIAAGSAFLEAGRMRNVLVIAADTLSRQSDAHDRSTAALFGDGAGAVVLSAGQTGGIGAIELGADGSASELITNDVATGLIRMQGHETFRAAVARMEQATRAVCARAGIDPVSDVDLFVFHQANARITRALVERLEIDEQRAVDCIAELGNTSAASLPLALEHARQAGRLQPGMRVLLCAVGAGFTWGAMLVDWSAP